MNPLLLLARPATTLALSFGKLEIANMGFLADFLILVPLRALNECLMAVALVERATSFLIRELAIMVTAATSHMMVGPRTRAHCLLALLNLGAGEMRLLLVITGDSFRLSS